MAAIRRRSSTRSSSGTLTRNGRMLASSAHQGPPLVGCSRFCAQMSGLPIPVNCASSTERCVVHIFATRPLSKKRRSEQNERPLPITSRMPERSNPSSEAIQSMRMAARLHGALKARRPHRRARTTPWHPYSNTESLRLGQPRRSPNLSTIPGVGCVRLRRVFSLPMNSAEQRWCARRTLACRR